MKRLIRSIYTAKNILSFNQLFHGSDIEVKKPDLIRRSRLRKDFGFGFYCTNIKEQAERWAREGKGRTSGVVTVYTWNPSVLNTLKCLEFQDIASKEGLEAWLNTIIRNRRKDAKSHDFDIIAGPMADDFIWSVVEEYVSAENDGEDLTDYFESVKEAALKFNRPTQQIVFCTQKAIDVLTFQSSYTV